MVCDIIYRTGVNRGHLASIVVWGTTLLGGWALSLVVLYADHGGGGVIYSYPEVIALNKASLSLSLQQHREAATRLHHDIVKRASLIRYE